MAFGQGFLAGFQVGDNYQNRKILMEQRQQDRDREQYERDLTALNNDLRHSQGDMDEETFKNSDEFARLVKRHAGSKVFEKTFQAGNGNRTKVRDLVRDSHGRHAIIVDTYDKEGRLISKGRPITENRESREKNPNDKVLLLTGEDLYNGMLGALQQSDGYVDYNMRADSAEGLMKAQTDLFFGSDEAPAGKQPAGKQPAGKQPAAGGSKGAPTADTQAADQPAAQRGDKAPLINNGPIASPVDPGPPDESTALEDMSPQEREAAEREQVLIDLNNEINMHTAQIDHATRMLREGGAAVPYQDRAKLSMQMEEDYKAIQMLQAQAEELQGGEKKSKAEKFGEAVGSIPGAVMDTAKEAAAGIADNPIVKDAVQTGKEFWKGVTGNEEEEVVPAPEGTPAPQQFERGAEETINKGTNGGTFADYMNGKPGVTQAPTSPAQNKKIIAVNEGLADTLEAQRKPTRKQLADYRKALHTQIRRGVMTVKEASANYSGVLAALKTKPDEWNISMNAQGKVLRYNKRTGQYDVNDFGDGGEGAAKSRKAELEEIKLMGDWSERIVGDKKNTRGISELTSMIDVSRNTMGFDLAQKGAYAAIEGAYRMRQSAVDSDTSPFGLGWLFTSKDDARRKNPSLTPFFAASLLGVDDAEKMTTLGKALQQANQGKPLTEADWRSTAQLSQALVTAGVQGDEAVQALKDLRAAGVQGQDAVDMINEYYGQQ